MTDNFLQKFEEKIMTLLAELETARKELSQLRLENANLKTEKMNFTKKLQSLVSLFDSLNTESNNVSPISMVHGQEDFATI